MTTGETQAINDRLDRQDEKLDKIVDAVTRYQVQREHCMGVHKALGDDVWGADGRNGLKGRVKELETVREIGSKGFWALVSLVAAIISGAILAIGGTLLAWMKGS